MRPAGAVSVLALILVGAGPSASANSTLRVTGDSCAVDADFNPVPAAPRLIGRVTVLDDQGVLHFEPSVILVRSGDSPDSCLVDFDVHFTPALLDALLDRNLFVKVEACGVRHGRNFEAAPGSVCAATDPAVLIVDEPLDTILDEVAREVLASYEATCPAGEALKRIDLDGGHECTPEFALDTDIDAERSERASADVALASNIDEERAARQSADGTLQASIASEAASRVSADGVLQASIDSEATTRASMDVTLNNARINGDLHSGDVSGAHNALSINPGRVGSLEIDPAQVQRRVTGSCTVGETISAIHQDGSVTCGAAGATREIRSSALVRTANCVREDPFLGECLDYEYTSSQTVTCSAGGIVTGGGYTVNKDRDFFVYRSMPISSVAWQVTLWSDYPDLTGTVYAVCLKVGS